MLAGVPDRIRQQRSVVQSKPEDSARVPAEALATIAT